MADRTCDRCNKLFRDASKLRRHQANKKPCVTDVNDPALTCKHCARSFSSKDSRNRHIRLSCQLRQAPINVGILPQLEARFQELENKINATLPSTITVNNVNVINNTVNIAQWGTPLSLTDSDIENVLSQAPSPSDTSNLGGVVSVLMELVKRAHVPAVSRNVFLNPKHSDQARALTQGGWATLSLSEATQVLFDGATAQIEMPRMVYLAMQPSLRSIRTTLPAQYRMEKANVVQLGLHPMGAHLANMAPGGAGPLLIEPAPMAPTTIAPAPAPAPTAPERFRKIVSEIPAAYSETGALHPGWIAEVVSKIALSPIEFYKLLEMEAAAGRFAEEWAGMQKLSQEKSKPRPSPADRP